MVFGTSTHQAADAVCEAIGKLGSILDVGHTDLDQLPRLCLTTASVQMLQYRDRTAGHANFV